MATAASSSARIRSLAKLAGAGFGLFATGLTVVTVVALLAPPLFGYERYVIYGASMEPTIAKGSVLYARDVPVSSLEKGDVITYVPPGSTRPVTHRISSVARARAGERVFETKGDANANADFRTFSLTRPTQATYAFHLPLLGWLLIAMADTTFHGVLIGGPALLAAAMIVRSLWRQGGELVEAQKQPEAEATG